MSSNHTPICARCLMDHSDPIITFNENGYCNHCAEFIEKRAKYNYKGETSDQEFVQVIAQIKAAGKGDSQLLIKALTSFDKKSE